MGNKRGTREEEVDRQLPSVRPAPRLLEELKEADEGTAWAKEALEDRVLEIILEGNALTARSVAIELGDASLQPLVQNIIWDTNFQVKLMNARKDMAISGIDRVRRKTHRWIRNMEDMAGSDDGRVKFAANQDLLNRAGTAPSQRVEIGPVSYLKALEGLTEDGDKDKPE